VRTPGRETQKFKRKAIRVDTSRILEAAIGYECHPETGQGIINIARKRVSRRASVEEGNPYPTEEDQLDRKD
jgi:hypothetical protein